MPDEQHRAVTAFGYTLSSEEHPPAELVDNARRAEEARVRLRLDLRPLPPMGHRAGPQPVRVDGARRHRRVDRTHRRRRRRDVPDHPDPPRNHRPGGRHHVAAVRRPVLPRRRHRRGAQRAHPRPPLAPPEVRRAMLEEAVDVIRALWTGDTVDHRGDYYEVENARLFDPPDAAPPIIVSGFGAEAVELAGRIGDGYWGHAPSPSSSTRFEAAGGTGPRYAQLNVCWAEDEGRAPARPCTRSGPTAASPASCRRTCRRGPTSSRRPSSSPRNEATESVPCGPDVEPRRRVASASTSTPATTTSTSTRSAPTRTASSTSGPTTLQPALADLDTSADRSEGRRHAHRRRHRDQPATEPCASGARAGPIPTGGASSTRPISRRPDGSAPTPAGSTPSSSTPPSTGSPPRATVERWADAGAARVPVTP